MQIWPAKYYRFENNLRGYREENYNEFIDLFRDRQENIKKSLFLKNSSRQINREKKTLSSESCHMTFNTDLQSSVNQTAAAA